MLRYIVRRILSVIPVLIGISVMAFMLGLLTPGDPAAMALGWRLSGDAGAFRGQEGRAGIK